MALNPMGKIPTLVDDGFSLWESAAILWYLASKHGGPLLPKDLVGEADTLRWMFFGSSHLDPHFSTFIFERFIKARRNQPPDETLTRAAEAQLARFVPVVEGQLAEREYV